MSKVENIIIGLSVFLIYILGLLILIGLSPIFALIYFGNIYRNGNINQIQLDVLEKFDGEKFFCFNNNKRSLNFIENEIIPNLNNKINIIFLEGKKANSSTIDNILASKLLLKIRQREGFPYILKISNGEILAKSINNELFNTINQNKDTLKLIDTINNY